MAASSRTMWSGNITLGLLNVPVTIGKATRDDRERGLRDLCATHKIPVSRNEHCNGGGGQGEAPCKLDAGKVKGVELPDGTWRVLNANEYASIEDATKLPTIEVQNVVPLKGLPLEFSQETYYVRSDSKSRGSEQVFAILTLALAKTGYGLVAKWCNSTKQKLVVLHAKQGMILMTQIPYKTELNLPGDAERRHFGVEPAQEQIDMTVALLDKIAEKGFDYGALADEGMKLRSAAIDRILAGEQQEQNEQQERAKDVPDIMATLRESMEEAGKA